MSALYLGAIAVALLFASDEILPRMIAGFPADASWLGQLVAGAWLGAAIVNWNGRANLLGGIYGRPQVSLNLMLYVVSALALVKARLSGPMFWGLTLPMALFGLVYVAVLLRGPFDARESTG